MKTIDGHQFPETAEEASQWRPVFQVKALHHKVLVVAKTRIEGKWAAYIFPVKGIDHDMEMHGWEDGAKLPEKVARAIFPEFQTLDYAS